MKRETHPLHFQYFDQVSFKSEPLGSYYFAVYLTGNAKAITLDKCCWRHLSC
jgi:hypothetical protein